jgi:hypothetical protein
MVRSLSLVPLAQLSLLAGQEHGRTIPLSDISRHGDVGEISFFRPPTLGYKSSICEGHIEVPNWEPKSGKLSIDIPN